MEVGAATADILSPLLLWQLDLAPPVRRRHLELAREAPDRDRDRFRLGATAYTGTCHTANAWLER